jgi:hypothetical protein
MKDYTWFRFIEAFREEQPAGVARYDTWCAKSEEVDVAGKWEWAKIVGKDLMLSL